MTRLYNYIWTITHPVGEMRLWCNYSVSTGIILILLTLCGCKSIQYVPVETIRTVEVKDTILKIDTVTFQVPVEVYKDYSALEDTLVLETSLAKAICWNSEGHINGQIENKPVKLEKEIEIREKVITKVEEKQIPVEVTKEVPFIPSWILWGLSIESLFILLLLGLWKRR